MHSGVEANNIVQKYCQCVLTVNTEKSYIFRYISILAFDCLRARHVVNSSCPLKLYRHFWKMKSWVHTFICKNYKCHASITIYWKIAADHVVAKQLRTSGLQRVNSARTIINLYKVKKVGKWGWSSTSPCSGLARGSMASVLPQPATGNRVTDSAIRSTNVTVTNLLVLASTCAIFPPVALLLYCELKSWQGI